MKLLSAEEIRQIELDILIEFDKLCKKNNLTYYLAFGTLLGAARHKGFIPWDDDIDVMMPRNDYEKFLKSFNVWNPIPYYKLQAPSDKHSIYSFAKIIDSRTVVIENFTRNDIKTGVWMDIFPLDNVNKNEKALFRQENRVALMRSFAVADSSIGSNRLIKLAKKIICPFAHKLNINKLACEMDKISKKYQNHDTGYLAIVSDGNPNWIFPQELFGSGLSLTFEGREFPAPVRFGEWLTIQYGNWKTPPSEDQIEIHVQEAYIKD